MVNTLQTFIQRRLYVLMMVMIGIGFVTLVIELTGYQHWEGFQLIGLSAIVVGALVSFIAIGANASLRKTLGIVFLVLAFIGLLGTVLHNANKLTGQSDEARRPPPTAIEGEPGEFRMPAPALAPLSMSGFCILGALVVLGRKDEHG